MTPAPFQCPACGSYDVEWLSDEEIRCLDCGKIFRYPPGAIDLLRHGSGLPDHGEPGNGDSISWDGVRGSLEED